MAKKPRLLTDSLIKKEQALIILEREALKAERKKHQRKYRMHSDETKIEVVKSFLALGGNLSLTATVVGITRDTLKVWKTTDWWKVMVAEVQKHEKIELSSKTKRILEKSMEVLADRVVNGDFQYDPKTGTLIRKPINAITAHKISSDLIERTEFLDKAVEEDPDERASDLARLSDLAKRFERLANKQEQQQNAKPAVEVVDVIFGREQNIDNVIFAEEVKNAPKES